MGRQEGFPVGHGHPLLLLLLDEPLLLRLPRDAVPRQRVEGLQDAEDDAGVQVAEGAEEGVEGAGGAVLEGGALLGALETQRLGDDLLAHVHVDVVGQVGCSIPNHWGWRAEI